jgi:hypothetical protein
MALVLGGGSIGGGGMPPGMVESVLTRKTWAVSGLVLVLCRARKYMRMQPGKILSLFRTRMDTNTRKRNPLDSPLNPFQNL